MTTYRVTIVRTFREGDDRFGLKSLQETVDPERFAAVAETEMRYDVNTSFQKAFYLLDDAEWKIEIVPD